MKMDTELSRTAHQLIEECRLALLTTADKAGWPHATWMNFQMKGYVEEIFTITAPTTQKVANLRANPRAEWMFSNRSMESIVMVSGPTHVIENVAVKQYWDAMPGKAHAFFRQYCETEDYRQFVVISTKVEKVVFCRPAGYRKIVVMGEGSGEAPH
jgi:general stress protein 26